jgi:dihydroorotase-like cyclic amidohydrolase
MPILITNARMVNEGTITEGDLLVRNHRIEQKGGSVTAPDGENRAQKLEFGRQR